MTDRQNLLRVEQLADFRSQLVAIPDIRNTLPAKELLDALNGNTRPLEKRGYYLPVAR
ncbi:hypothetical protein RSO01_50260 [Reyranella soli]|uniref:Uncharacterized protein n=1 Tax=Reyranella soli TaxID=1230389 RepID=A0A512NFY5_9HYPH|nr:hypothetical protein RSO01_50260 [Reyranella soli]